MKRFYLLRHEDLHGHAGIGVVAEGVIFDSGMCAMTWLSKYQTVTTFPRITVVKALHGHEGRTEVIIEGRDKRFASCQEKAREMKSQNKRKEENESEG